MGRRCVIEGVSVGMGFEIPHPEPDMNCPELPHREGNNFWSSSCVIKQTMPEHHKTCYPHCKGGKTKAEPKFYDDEAQEAHAASISAGVRTKYAKQLADRACEMFKAGKSVKQIAEILCRSTRLIERRLQEADLSMPPGEPSKRSQAFEVWHKDPKTTVQQVMEMFRLTRHTVEKYKREFTRQHIHDLPLKDLVFNWLDGHPDAKTVEVVAAFDIHSSTASDYRMRYRRSARYRSLTR